MFQVSLSTTSPGADCTTAAVRIGGVATDTDPPARHAFVTQDDKPVLSLELRPNDQEAQAFVDAIIWQGFVVIGWCERLYLIRLATREVTEHPLGSYFGYLHAADSALFVSSAEQVFRIDTEGEIEWRSEVVGLDGVLIHEVSTTAISGEGEWDAPGAWRPYRLNPSTGRALSD